MDWLTMCAVFNPQLMRFRSPQKRQFHGNILSSYDSFKDFTI